MIAVGRVGGRERLPVDIDMRCIVETWAACFLDHATHISLKDNLRVSLGTFARLKRIITTSSTRMSSVGMGRRGACMPNCVVQLRNVERALEAGECVEVGLI